MKLATWNVNSINVRLEHVLRWLRETGTDVLCVQETKCTDDNFPNSEFEAAGYHTAFMGEKSYNGVAIISKNKIENVQRNMPEDFDDAPKRFLAADIGGVHFVNTYIPNGTKLWSDKFEFKLDWLARLRKYFDKNCQPEKNVVLLGDFNVAMEDIDVWNTEKWEGKLHFSLPERAAMFNVKQWGFSDTFRTLNPSLNEFSWWDFRTNAFSRNEGLRIDYVWASQALMKLCSKSYIDQVPRGWERPSDHTPVVSEFKF
ncbi:MAG: exodeoxyribonuclease III [Pyrinomonadaceae bacterium]